MTSAAAQKPMKDLFVFVFHFLRGVAVGVGIVGALIYLLLTCAGKP